MLCTKPDIDLRFFHSHNLRRCRLLGSQMDGSWGAFADKAVHVCAFLAGTAVSFLAPADSVAGVPPCAGRGGWWRR